MGLWRCCKREVCKVGKGVGSQRTASHSKHLLLPSGVSHHGPSTGLPLTYYMDIYKYVMYPITLTCSRFIAHVAPSFLGGRRWARRGGEN